MGKRVFQEEDFMVRTSIVGVGLSLIAGMLLLSPAAWAQQATASGNVASGSINAPEVVFSYRLHPAGLYQVTWNAPVTNRLLFEAGGYLLMAEG
jgi:hypothetical protein